MPVQNDGVENKAHFTVADVLAATGGRHVSGPSDGVFKGVLTDSRKVAGGEFFVALVGERHDAHRFVADVAQAGAGGALVEESRLDQLDTVEIGKTGTTLIAVPDTGRGFGDLAAWHRRRLGVRVVGITGTNGKTSAKEFLASVLAGRYRTLATVGNFNNLVGVPITLFRLDEQHEWAVLELGMNHAGEIARLTEITAPDIGIITNVGPGHLEGVGSLGGVLSAKKELLDHMPGQVAVLNADDRTVAGLADGFSGRVLLFGWSPDADVRARDLVQDRDGLRFVLEIPDGAAEVRLAMHGACMVSNALAAAAGAYAAGLGLDDIRRGLERSARIRGRQNVRILGRGIGLVDDTYNANPASMSAAIDTLVTLKGEGRAFLVVGDMLELGRYARQAHEKLGSLAAISGISRVFAAGAHANDVARGALEGGMSPDQVVTGDKKTLTQGLLAHLEPGDWVLVKGSRGMGMEEVAAGLEQGLANT
ncbi:MAG: UDP-N-acetylmuramoyl-tripeptide--D-alanyl-D-alanine ligase [Desulfatibacillaceae bacterium]